MRSVDGLSSTAPLAWLRAGIDRSRRALMARSPAVRASLILALVLGLASAVYWSTMALAPTGTRYLPSARPFSSDDLTRIRQAFDEKGISYHIDDRKVEIAADQYDQAQSVYARLHIGEPSLEQIRSPERNWLDAITETTQAREQGERLRQERYIEHLLNDLDGIVSSRVSIQWPRSIGPRQARGKPSAFISVEIEPNRPLPTRTRRVIPTIVARNVPELSEQAITVIDHRGYLIFDPLNPSHTDSSRDQAREEEVRKKILENLSYIKGVRVFVRLSGRHDEPSRPAPASTGPGRPEPGPAMGVNQPTELEEPTPAKAEVTRPAPAPPAAPAEHGEVLVYVPRSFYFNRMLPAADRREPTSEMLKESINRTREQVIKLVRLEVPSWKVEVDTFPDDEPLGRPAMLPDARRKASDWGIVAAVAAAVAFVLVTALASLIQVVRRPAHPGEGGPRTRRYRADADDEPDPSERVRELVRRDPEAAASVLQRWTTQGGRVS
jgi:flagellar biosynthesis/type III secretory pathway M-ring protein FliF/YscJ